MLSFLFRKLPNFCNYKNNISSKNWNLYSFCDYLTMLFQVFKLCNVLTAIVGLLRMINLKGFSRLLL